MQKLKKGNYVAGVFSPFVHGRINRIRQNFAYLENGEVYPLISLRRVSKKCEANLPDFAKTLRSSKNGLNF